MDHRTDEKYVYTNTERKKHARIIFIRFKKTRGPQLYFTSIVNYSFSPIREGPYKQTGILRNFTKWQEKSDDFRILKIRYFILHNIEIKIHEVAAIR